MTQQEIFKKYQEEHCSKCENKGKDCTMRIRIDNTVYCEVENER